MREPFLKTLSETVNAKSKTKLTKIDDSIKNLTSELTTFIRSVIIIIGIIYLILVLGLLFNFFSQVPIGKLNQFSFVCVRVYLYYRIVISISHLFTFRLTFCSLTS